MSISYVLSVTVYCVQYTVQQTQNPAVGYRGHASDGIGLSKAPLNDMYHKMCTPFANCLREIHHEIKISFVSSIQDLNGYP
jgi:hypothetical protein